MEAAPEGVVKVAVAVVGAAPPPHPPFLKEAAGPLTENSRTVFTPYGCRAADMLPLI